MKKCLLIINIYKPEAKTKALEIQNFLQNKQIQVETLLYEHTIKDFPYTDIDFVITLGGDGTVLFAARKVASLQIPIFPINFGQFGFIAGIAPNNWQEPLNQFLNNSANITKREMLKIEVFRNEQKIFASTALNDAVIRTGGPAQIAELVVDYDNHSFGKFAADGVIVSTPTGSTAYSVAAGGPIVDPNLDAFVLNPICPFSLSNRPLVLNSSGKLSISILPSRGSEIFLTCDGQNVQKLQKDDIIIIEQDKNKALLIGCDSFVFYSALQSKLNWSGGPNA